MLPSSHYDVCVDERISKDWPSLLSILSETEGQVSVFPAIRPIRGSTDPPNLLHTFIYSTRTSQTAVSEMSSQSPNAESSQGGDGTSAPCQSPSLKRSPRPNWETSTNKKNMISDTELAGDPMELDPPSAPHDQDEEDTLMKDPEHERPGTMSASSPPSSTDSMDGYKSSARSSNPLAADPKPSSAPDSHPDHTRSALLVPSPAPVKGSDQTTPMDIDDSK